jgi:hypothetical protein
MAVRLSLLRRFQRKSPRLAKFMRQWSHVMVHGMPRSRIVFVVGSQRSGTRLPLELLDCSSEVMTYSEGSAPFFDGVLLRPLDTVEGLVERNPFPIVALKPICETHRVPELLGRFDQSRALWIFRNYRAAVTSASVKWSSGTEAVRRLAAGELDRAGWRAGGLTAAKLDLVRDLYSDKLSLHGANAIMWYLRNGLYFDLAVDKRDDVLLIRYETLLSEPQSSAERIFNFAGVSPVPNYAGVMRGTPTSKSNWPSVPRQIEDLCDQLQSRLIEHHQHRSSISTLTTSRSRAAAPIAAQGPLT